MYDSFIDRVMVRLGFIGKKERKTKINKAFIDIRLRPRNRNAARGGSSHGHRGSVQKCREDRSSSSGDMLADRHTDAQTDRQTNRNTPLAYRGGVKYVKQQHETGTKLHKNQTDGTPAQQLGLYTAA